MDQVYYLLHGLQDRYSALYQDNIGKLGDQDVLVASIGGSGQTFLGNILIELGVNYVDGYTEALLENGSSEPVAAYADYRERLSGTRTRDRSVTNGFAGTWPRFVKTHLTPEFFAGRPLRGVWILARDPRDALYSWYQFRVNVAKDPLDILAAGFEDWVAERPGPTGLSRLDDWADFYRRWNNAREELPVSATSTFEALKADPVSSVRRGLGAFGISVDTAQVAAAVERSDFSAMREHERAQQQARGGTGEGGRIMRRGKPNEWLEWMTPSLSERFREKRIASVAADFGYRLDTTGG